MLEDGHRLAEMHAVVLHVSAVSHGGRSVASHTNPEYRTWRHPPPHLNSRGCSRPTPLKYRLLRLTSRILEVDKFAVLRMVSTGMSTRDLGSSQNPRVGSLRAIDIVGQGVRGDWAPMAHLHIVKVGNTFVSRIFDLFHIRCWLSHAETTGL